ncbi:MAG: Rieske 2Fe-2S domain-containing protein [Candidatus Dormibacteraeota bacterium]|uniref:Rieske 2Fe-2S domain-containing protein n=1 Tax=Candidatus Amunia macphersoniae TaxID=3127014 RepID=A0A934KL33_9BACT|nr:Rieske 2Fe-2S domain-containing protein [Candidatus Dormibacteraeota bacterium]
MALRDLVRPLEGIELFDPVGDWLGDTVHRLVGNGAVKSALSGTWLGHSLHPVLTDLPIGFLSSATVLDLFGGEDAAGAADALTVLGLVSVAPTAAAGASDWADTSGADRRLGLIHALANAGSSVLFAAALVSRRGRYRRTAHLFSIAGIGVLSASGYIGGHLVYGRGMGVDHTVFDDPPTEWTRVARDDDVAADTPLLVSASGYGVLLYRHAGVVHAIANRCTHAGGPLNEGQVDDELCVTCPWHGSQFRLADGAVTRGPATAPQPAFTVRIRDANVEVRRREA